MSVLGWELIRANRKIFCGYSDITARPGDLHLILAQP